MKTRFKVVYNKLYEKWQVKRFSPVFGWICLEEFNNSDDAYACMKRLENMKKNKR